MFSLKLDVLFPSLNAAKELAHKLNPRRPSPRIEGLDPRELRRIRMELGEARDRAKALSLIHRNRIS
jgi:hypothetical protein